MMKRPDAMINASTQNAWDESRRQAGGAHLIQEFDGPSGIELPPKQAADFVDLASNCSPRLRSAGGRDALRQADD